MWSARASSEKVYERALIYELALRGVSAKAQVSFPISYKGKYLGEYVAGLRAARSRDYFNSNDVS